MTECHVAAWNVELTFHVKHPVSRQHHIGAELKRNKRQVAVNPKVTPSRS